MMVTTMKKRQRHGIGADTAAAGTVPQTSQRSPSTGRSHASHHWVTIRSERALEAA